MRSTPRPRADDLRVRRGTRALVAQYIHELSVRHAADREAAARRARLQVQVSLK